MAFQQGLSGLNAASKSLDVIGNNIANSSTVGFKASQAQFADIYATSLNGVSGNQAGIGVSVSTVAQTFSQGSITTSSNPLDIAINGNGFFRVYNDNEVQYTRNGQFTKDANNFIINAQGAQLTGYLADSNGKITAGNPVPIQLDVSDMKPKETTTIATEINLDSNSTQPATVPFDADDGTSYTKAIPTKVYDSLGNSHTLENYYVKTGTDANGEATWDVYQSIDGKEVTAALAASAAQTDPASIAARATYQTAVTAVPLDATAVQAAALAYAQTAGAAVLAAATTAGASTAQQAAISASFGSANTATLQGLTPDAIDVAIGDTVAVPPVKAGSLIFTTTGTLDKTAMLAATPSQAVPFTLTLPVFPATGANTTIPISLDFTGSTQFATSSAEKLTTQDGYAGGSLSSYSPDTNGLIVGSYSNGQTRDLAQIVMANFADPNGLTPLGNNVWSESSASGTPTLGVPNTAGLGALQPSAVESSNTDLTAELVNMITAQRAYQANAQTIKTEDQILQTLVNLR